MASFKRPDLIQILDGSFDAGLMIDKKGKVRYANVPAQQMLGNPDDDEEDSDILFGGVHMDALMEFLEKDDSSDDIPWKDIYQSLCSLDGTQSTLTPTDPYSHQWTVKFRNQTKATIRLIKIKSPDHNDYILAFLKYQEEQRTCDINAHHINKITNGKTFDSTDDPMLAIDQSGLVLMANHAALEKIDWIDEGLVGRNIVSPLSVAMRENSSDPVLTVDESGIVIDINDTAIENVDWITQDLMGQSVLSLEAQDILNQQKQQKHQDDEASQAEQVSVSLYSWFTTTSSVETPSKSNHKRKKSPEVIRIFLASGDLTINGDNYSTTGLESYISRDMFSHANPSLVSHNNTALGPSFPSDSLQQRDNILMAIVEASLDPLFQINEKGIIQMVNKAAVRQFGYSREEMLGSNISLIVGGGHAKHHDKYLQRYLQTGDTKVIGQKRELTARRSDGTEFPIELGVVEVDTFSGDERLFCGFVHDLSSIKRKERITNDIVEASLDPMFLIGESGKIRMVNIAAVRQFQYTRDELLNANISLIVGGGHAEKHDNYLRNYVRSGKREGNVVGKLRELQARRKDGSEFPIQLGVIEMKTSSEEERMFCGFVHDLTEIKQREHISHGIIESSLDAMLQIDDHGKIEMVNEAAIKILGWTREELIGSNISKVVGGGHGRHHDKYLKRFRDTGVLNLVGKRRELKARKKDGNEFPVEIYITRIEDDITKKVKFCGFLRDLTDTKLKEGLTSGLIDASVDPMFSINSKGDVVMVNNAATKLFGWSREEFLERNIAVICGGDHAAYHSTYLEEYMKGGNSGVIGQRRTLPAKRKDGSEFWVELTVVEVRTETGEVYFCGHAKDMTEICRKQEILNGIIEASFDPLFVINEKGIIQIMNGAAARQFGWAPDELIGQNLAHTIVGKEHAKHHDEYLKKFLKTGVKKVIGQRRELPARRKDGSEFTVELGLAEIELSSGNERMFCGFIRDLTPSKAQQETTLQHERLMSGIFCASLDPLFSINSTGTIQTVNNAACGFFGWTEKEFLGQNISMIVGGGHAKNHDSYLKHYILTGEKRVMGKERELKARRKDGTEVHIELSLSEVETREEDERIFVGVVRDLSRRKSHERAILEEKQETERKARLVTGIINASPDSLFQINSSGIIQIVNKTACEVFDYYEDELVGHNISKIVGGGHAEHHDEYLQRYLKTGVARVIGKERELKARRSDGSEFFIELHLSEIETNVGDERLFVGFVRDITERKRNQRSIEKRERLVTGIINAATDPLFQIDETGRIQTVNQAACTVFGYTEDEFIGHNIRMIVGGGHAKHHDKYLKHFMETGEAKVMGKERELLARRKNGSEFAVMLSLKEIKTRHGNHRLFCGFIRDISKRKEQEQIILKRERLMAGIIESSMSPMFQIQSDGIIQTVNPAACRVFGYNEREFIGKNISMIVGAEHAPHHDKYLERYLETGIKRVMGKSRRLSARRSDGTEFLIELSLTEIETDDGDDRLFCGFVSDISEQARKEAITTGLIDASLDPIFQIDKEGMIMNVNKAAEEHFQYTRKEFIGSNVSMIVGGEHAAHHDAYLEQYFETGRSGVIGKRRVLPGRRKDGSELDIELAVVEVKTGDEVYFCGYARILQNGSSVAHSSVASTGEQSLHPDDEISDLNSATYQSDNAQEQESNSCETYDSDSDSSDPDAYFR